MVKEKKKNNIIDLVSKYFVCEDSNFQEKINQYLEELKEIYSLAYIKVESLISHKSYGNIEDIDIKEAKYFHIETFADIYFTTQSESFFNEEEIVESVRLGVSVLEEQERNSLIFDLTSEVRKCLRPDIALENYLKDSVNTWI